MIQNLSANRAEQASFYRFLKNKKVTLTQLTTQLQTACIQNMIAGHYLALQDTTEINLERHTGRLNHNKSGLGVVGNNKDTGFFLHPSLLFNPTTKAFIGFTSTQLWTRDPNRPKERDKTYPKLRITQKESNKWLQAAQDTSLCLKQAKTLLETQTNSTNSTSPELQITMVSDRESDIYAYFNQCPEDLNVLVRVCHDRIVEIEDETGKRQGLYEYLRNCETQGNYELNISNDKQKKRTARVAKMEVRFAQVKLPPPRKGKGSRVAVSVIEAREQASSVPAGEQPIVWRLMTTHEVLDLSMALTVIGWYVCRWLIETFFASLKGSGLLLERSELEDGMALQRLTLLALPTALRVMQLQVGREDEVSLAGRVFSEAELSVVVKVMGKFEGKTVALKNPFSELSLAWVTWLIARLGGWMGYASQRPAGVLTLTRGLRRFEGMVLAFELFRE